MHCFICVTYLMIVAAAHPPNDREVSSKTHEKRSIFNDVIQSLRMRARLPDDIDLNDENNIGQNYDRYGIDSDNLQLPNDLDFAPRRNDRLEMPPAKYRFPKDLKTNETFDSDKANEEIVVYINTPVEDGDMNTTTQKPKKQKRPRPPVNKHRNPPPMKTDEESIQEENNDRPFTNTMGGQSQIGNRESQTVVKPTVIVNFRGSVMHRENDIRLERRRNENSTIIPQNIFNINQEIKVERTDAMDSIYGMKKTVNLKDERETRKALIEEDMMMCETSSSKDKKENKRLAKNNYDVLQIRLTL